MTDRELLELAAKAAGIMQGGVFDWCDHDQCFIRHEPDASGISGPWNPLDDDGDALRLAINLGIYFMIVTEEGKVSTRIRNGIRSFWSENIGHDVYSATRRAIVRAAAEIGKAMP